MLKIYKTTAIQKNTKKIKKVTVDSWIDLVKPTINEIEEVIKTTNVSEDLIYKMLDNDELPRIEISNNSTLIVIDTPVIDDDGKYKTSPLGLIITTNGFVITISNNKNNLLSDFKKNRIKDFRTAKKTRFLLQILLKVTNEYVIVLKNLYKNLEEKEDKLNKSTKNEDLIELLSMEKTLVYFITSLKENKSVLERLKKGNVIQMYEGDLDLLEDVQIELDQAIDMSSIYKDILSSITDTYATIISNNLNIVMKFLAGMTIVISIPNIIFSFFGMNVKFSNILNNIYSSIIIFTLSIIIGLVVALILKKKDML